MEFTQEETGVIWLALDSFIEDQIYFVQDYVDGDEEGIKCNLTVQSIVFTVLKETVQSIEMLEKITNHKNSPADKVVANEIIARHKDFLDDLNTEIRIIQGG